MSAEKKRWLGESDEVYPEVFNTLPKLKDEKKTGQLSNDELEQFFDKGWIVVDNFFQPEELNPAKDSIKDLVEQLAQKLYKAGKITKLYNEFGFYQRLTMIEREFPGANILLHKLGKLPESFQDIWSNERLLNLAEQILDTKDIAGHPVWNLRTKTPKNEATTVPWHQDSAYLDKNAYKVLQLTAWIPLIDANENNGCMQLVENAHKSGKVAMHQCCHGSTWYVMLEEDEMEKTLGVKIDRDLRTVPVSYGSVLLFSNVLPHRSLNNFSDQIRWSLDLRWQRADKSVGFYGLKDGVRMRSSTDPNHKIDWDTFNGVDRTSKQYEYLEKEQEEFDITIPGPWMKNWEIVHMNEHTTALAEQEKAGVVDFSKLHQTTG